MSQAQLDVCDEAHGLVPLALAAAAGRARAAAALLAAGANAEAKDRHGKTPLMWAAAFGHAAVAAELLRLGTGGKGSAGEGALAGGKGEGNGSAGDRISGRRGAELTRTGEGSAFGGSLGRRNANGEGCAGERDAEGKDVGGRSAGEGISDRRGAELLRAGEGVAGEGGAGGGRARGDGAVGGCVQCIGSGGQMRREENAVRQTRLRATDCRGWNPFFHACHGGHVELVEAWVGHVDLAMTDQGELSPSYTPPMNRFVAWANAPSRNRERWDAPALKKSRCSQA